jgi:hypothetical protein
MLRLAIGRVLLWFLSVAADRSVPAEPFGGGLSAPEKENLSREYIDAGMPGWPMTRSIISADSKDLEAA